jgi:aubergine-like protein
MISTKPTLNTKFNRVALRSNHYSLKFEQGF